MSNEKIAEKIQEFIDDKIRDLPNEDYKEVLEIIVSNNNSSLDAYEEDHEND